ncbi:MAG: L-histidine N(alpha)-methyltransferase [Halopseudomonas sp.]|uniref:L-histidine N(alpha)-methyltransferase n=1 Tax=Halopseudomonas sp. TaxID=2901191 RepID=UPI0030033181
MSLALDLPRLQTALRLPTQDERQQLLHGLLQPRAHIDSKYFYDDRGCELFTAICRLDEYYPTRTEARIFSQHREAIAEQLPGHMQWIDLGCGDCRKTEDWLSAVAPARVIGVDIAGEFLQTSLAEVAQRHPQLECIGVVSDFTQHLDLHELLAERPSAPPVFFYPGSSIGNFEPRAAMRFLRRIRAHCGQHGRLLIGADLVKPRDILEAAYDDASGVTAEFNLNVLNVVNRELDADFNAAHFRHFAHFDEAHRRVEMHLVSAREQNVNLGVHANRRFGANEHILTEYSHKYSLDEFRALLAASGLRCSHYWTDPQDWFGVFLAEPV